MHQMNQSQKRHKDKIEMEEKQRLEEDTVMEKEIELTDRSPRQLYALKWLAVMQICGGVVTMFMQMLIHIYHIEWEAYSSAWQFMLSGPMLIGTGITCYHAATKKSHPWAISSLVLLFLSVAFCLCELLRTCSTGLSIISRCRAAMDNHEGYGVICANREFRSFDLASLWYYQLLAVGVLMAAVSILAGVLMTHLYLNKVFTESSLSTPETTEDYYHHHKAKLADS